MTLIKELESYFLLHQSSSEQLAAQIVVYKSLGINKSLALCCMLELARRRNLGEDFQYENFIEDELKKIPQISNYNITKLVNDIKFSVGSVTEKLQKNLKE